MKNILITAAMVFLAVWLVTTYIIADSNSFKSELKSVGDKTITEMQKVKP